MLAGDDALGWLGGIGFNGGIILGLEKLGKEKLGGVTGKEKGFFHKKKERVGEYQAFLTAIKVI